MSDARITFAIPFFGSARYLRRAIESVRAQTVSNWLAIVIDDCGPETGVEALLEDVGDARITYSRNPRNLGLAGNWNRCIEASSTPLVTLLHSDDELLPNYAHTMLDAHARWPHAAAIFCGARIIDDESRETFSFRDYVKRWLLPSVSRPLVLAGEEGVRQLARGNIVMCPTLCYNRARLRGMKFSPDLGFVVDLDFYLRALFDGAEFVGVPEIAYRYRRHPDQVTVQCERDLRMFTEQVTVLRWAASESYRRGWERAGKVAEHMSMTRLQICYHALADVARLRIRDALAKASLLRSTSQPLGKVA